MANPHQEEAKRRLTALLKALRAQPNAAGLADVIAMGEQLERAIATFHMEAIRFEMFTMGRQLARVEPALPASVHDEFAAVGAALEAAGFHTRSVPH